MTRGVIVSKNVAVFVDVANIFYAAKAAGVDIDYVTLLKATTAGRDFVRAYAYTGLDPENENQRNFHAFLARHGYKVVSKDIRKYGDGKVKANLDIELVVDLMKTARNLDIAVVVSGDGDFASAIRAVQEMGVRVEVVSFRGNTSSDLIDVADIFMDITQVAKVEKGSRSGRRVAGDEEDLSMTEVPEKQTEGTGRRRGRGGRTSRTTEPVAAAGREARSARKPVALPGERLSKLEPAEGDGAGLPEEAEEPQEVEVATAEGEEALEEGGRRRRRRRRGGRGRGRGRSAEGMESAEAAEAAEAAEGEGEELEEAEELSSTAAPRGPRPTPFGSVWDSQLGMPTGPMPTAGPVPEDEEDLEEPEIPEYLIAERNRARSGRGGGGRGPRGGRSAYAAALDRERFGGGRSSSINRYPDVSGRTGGRQQEPPRRQERQERHPRQERPDRRDRSSEPWSEVPPELEEMLRAQMAAKTSQPEGSTEAPRADATAAQTEDEATGAVEAPKASGRGRRGRASGAAAVAAAGPTGPADDGATAVAAEAPAPKRRTRRASSQAVAESPAPAPETSEPAPAEPAAPRRRTTKRTTAAPEAEPVDEAAATPEATKPARRRTTRKSSAEGAAGSDADAPAQAASAPKRRTRRTAATSD
jgi:uncharacterized LabA/DUF88 family protein